MVVVSWHDFINPVVIKWESINLISVVSKSVADASYTYFFIPRVHNMNPQAFPLFSENSIVVTVVNLFNIYITIISIGHTQIGLGLQGAVE